MALREITAADARSSRSYSRSDPRVGRKSAGVLPREFFDTRDEMTRFRDASTEIHLFMRRRVSSRNMGPVIGFPYTHAAHARGGAYNPASRPRARDLQSLSHRYSRHAAPQFMHPSWSEVADHMKEGPRFVYHACPVSFPDVKRKTQSGVGRV